MGEIANNEAPDLAPSQVTRWKVIENSADAFPASHGRDIEEKNPEVTPEQRPRWCGGGAATRVFDRSRP